MVYGTAQAGFNLYPNQGLNITSVIPGERYTFFDGTETPVTGLTSVSIARGPSGGQSQAYSTFYVKGGDDTTAVDIQASNTDIDADYFTIGTITGTGGWTDSGSPAFYRVKINTYSTGAMPIVTVQR